MRWLQQLSAIKIVCLQRGFHLHHIFLLSYNCSQLTNKNKWSRQPHPACILRSSGVTPTLPASLASSPLPSLRLIVMTSKNVTNLTWDNSRPAQPYVRSPAGGMTEITIFSIFEENDAAQYQFQVLMNDPNIFQILLPTIVLCSAIPGS